MALSAMVALLTKSVFYNFIPVLTLMLLHYVIHMLDRFIYL